MSKILLISFYYPPRQSIASVRARGLAKYLPAYGFETTVLTPHLPDREPDTLGVLETPYPGDVTELLQRYLRPRGSTNTRAAIADKISTLERESWFGPFLIRALRGFIEYPDNQRLWRKYAYAAGEKCLQTECYDAILSTSYPVTSHLIAADLKQKFSIPWVADLRDLWTQSHLRPYGGIRRRVDRHLEQSTLTHADAIVTVSQPMACKLGNLHGREVFTITNGFDPDEQRNAKPLDSFSITYTGRIDPIFQDPAPLFEAINFLLTRKVISRQEIAVRFFGNDQSWLERKICAHNLADVVVQCGALPRDRVLEIQSVSQLLLLLDWNDESEKGVYTGKVFEYLAATRPIITIGKAAGVLKDLMENTGAGNYCRNAEETAVILSEAIGQYRANGCVTYRGKAEEINKYSHTEMARKFAEILAGVIQAGKHPYS